MANSTLFGAAMRLPVFAGRKRGQAVLVPAIALAILILIILMAVLAPWLAPHDPVAMTPSARLKPASDIYPLGSDAYGRDLLSRVLYGARISFLLVSERLSSRWLSDWGLAWSRASFGSSTPWSCGSWTH